MTNKLNNGLGMSIGLGLQLAAEGIARAELGAEGQWKVAALDAVYKVAAKKASFTTDDVWMELNSAFRYLDPKSRDNRAMGGVMRQAARLNYCLVTNRTAKTARVSNHARPLAVWESLLASDAILNSI